MNKNFWNIPLRKHHRLSGQILSIVSPILEAFDLTQFCYFFVTESRHSACLSTHPAWTEFYLTNNLFHHNPFLKSTNLLAQGIFLSENIRDNGFLDSKREAQKFGIGDSVTLTVKTPSKLEGFSFST